MSTYRAITLWCSTEPCKAHLAFPWATRVTAYKAARMRGWVADSRQQPRCPVHKEAQRVPAPTVTDPRVGAKPWRFTRAQEKRIAQQYADGKTTTELGAQYEAHPSQIRRAVLRQGGTMRSRGRRAGR